MTAVALDFLRGGQGKSVTAIVGLVEDLVKVVGGFLLSNVVVRVYARGAKVVGCSVSCIDHVGRCDELFRG